jgi:flagellar hook assembly protein FlgD
VQYTLRDLPEGRQSVTIKAWDIYNNSTQTEVDFDVKLVSDLSMYQVFNFPNPVSKATVFTFQRNSTEPIDVTVKIFTVAGRLVDEIEVRSILDRFVQIPWDARDRNGDSLANGVYFYKIITSSADRGSSREALGKLTLLR